jgi:hypothetical protein
MPSGVYATVKVVTNRFRTAQEDGDQQHGEENMGHDNGGYPTHIRPAFDSAREAAAIPTCRPYG